MLSYYFNLPKDRERDFQGNLSASYAIQKTAKTAFEPFEVYLKNAIAALCKLPIIGLFKSRHFCLIHI
jgi:hypothetical protein